MKTLLLALTFICSANLNAQNVSIPDANFKAYLVGNSLINTNVDATRYGYLEARRDFRLDSINGLKKHKWIYNTTSKEYIDLRICLEKMYQYTAGSRARMLNIIDESKNMLRILKPLKNETKIKE